MQRTRFVRNAFVLAFTILVFCTAFAERNLNELVPPVMKLTRAVEGELVYGEHSSGATDEQLLETTMKSDPALKKELDGTLIELRHNATRVIVLVCSPDGKRGWLEDASWTPEIDNKWFELDKNHACEFTLQLNE